MTLRDDIIAQATARKGIPYGLPPGPGQLDCSLFVVEVLAASGIPLPPGVRTAEQIRWACVPIGWDDVKSGDLLFFEGTYDAGPPSADGHIASHIGISLGAGSHTMWDAHERTDGTGVGVTVLSEWWQPKLFEARRPPGLAGLPTTPPQEPPMPPVATLPRGVDVASYQGSVDWPAVAASGIAFAFTKVTEDDGYLNPTFAGNWAGIKAAGLARGAYHFARPEGADAVTEADWFLEQIAAAGGLEVGDLLALDLESGSGDLGGWTLDFLRHVEQRAGFRPLVYTGAWFTSQHNIAAYPELAQYGLWLAAYQGAMPQAPAPWSLLAFWQYSSTGRVPGVVGDVDLNMFNGPADRIRLYGKPAGAVVEPPPPPPPPPPGLPTRYELDTLITSLVAIRDRLPA